jgi:hypothetical protein
MEAKDIVLRQVYMAAKNLIATVDILENEPQATVKLNEAVMILRCATHNAKMVLGE